MFHMWFYEYAGYGPICSTKELKPFAYTQTETCTPGVNYRPAITTFCTRSASAHCSSKFAPRRGGEQHHTVALTNGQKASYTLTYHWSKTMLPSSSTTYRPSPLPPSFPRVNDLRLADVLVSRRLQTCMRAQCTNIPITDRWRGVKYKTPLWR